SVPSGVQLFPRSLFIATSPSCYTLGMQPDDQRPYQEPSYGPERADGPVVTLTPDENQAVEAVYPVDNASDSPQDTSSEPIRWQATEYIHREKDHVWFA